MYIMKSIVYSCVFYNENYINLLKLLLSTYKHFGSPSDDVDYLVICHPSFESKIKNIFQELNIRGSTWCLYLQTKFEAGYSRLKIFEYPMIHSYDKILYLDSDILVTGKIESMLNFSLEDKLYALEEGNTNHEFWGAQFFETPLDHDAFTSGILLFKNSPPLKKLFLDILEHIYTYTLPIPKCLDQPFIVYHAFKNNMYDNKTLIGKVVNNPTSVQGETICHFPGGPGNYGSKIAKMNSFLHSNKLDIVMR